MAYGDITRYTAEVEDKTDGSPFFWATLLDEHGNVVAAAEGTFAEDALSNAAIKANNREYEKRQAVPTHLEGLLEWIAADTQRIHQELAELNGRAVIAKQAAHAAGDSGKLEMAHQQWENIGRAMNALDGRQ